AHPYRLPSTDRADADDRAPRRSRLRLPAGARGRRRARGSVRDRDPHRRRSGHAHRGGSRGASRGAGRAGPRAAGDLMIRERTLPQALAEAARAGAGYRFITGTDLDGVTRPYAEIQSAALQVATSLRDAGLRHGDLVAIVLADAESFLTALFGASIAGTLPASLHPPSATGEVAPYFELTARTLRASEARAVVTTTALAPQFEALRATCPHLSLVLTRESLDAPPLQRETRPSLDDIAFVQFTSGSTAAPKGVVLTHRNVCANVDAINGPAGLATGDTDVGVSWLPLSHDMGLVGMALGPLYTARP